MSKIENIDFAFVELIKKKVIDLRGAYSVPILREIINPKSEEEILSKNPIYDLMKHGKATYNTLNIISNALKISDYHSYIKQIRITLNLAKQVEGHWVSYRFDSSRRIHVSYWSFEYNKNFNFFEVRKVSNSEDFEGKFYINQDSLFTGKLKNGNTSLHYISYFDLKNEIKVLTLNVTFNKKKEVYFSREVIYKTNKNIPNKGYVKKGEIELFDSSKSVNVNQLYEAYNYLTYMSNHNRILLDSQKWKYEHKIFISFPVRSLYGLGQERFKEIKGIMEQIIDKFRKPPFNFNKSFIFNELIASSYNEIKDENRVFKNVKKYIDSTHFIAILPKGLSDRNSGCYFEIYYRITKKLPCLVLYDKTVKFPHTLKGFVENNRQNNIRFKEIELKRIPAYLSKLDVLDLNIY